MIIRNDEIWYMLMIHDIFRYFQDHGSERWRIHVAVVYTYSQGRLLWIRLLWTWGFTISDLDCTDIKYNYLNEINSFSYNLNDILELISSEQVDYQGEASDLPDLPSKFPPNLSTIVVSGDTDLPIQNRFSSDEITILPSSPKKFVTSDE